MASNNLEGIIKLAKSRFNKRDYEQFILPICKAYEQTNNVTFREEVRKLVDNILMSSLTKLKEQVITIDEEEYVNYQTVEETLNQEKNNYLI